MTEPLINWLREACAGFVFNPEGVYQRTGMHPWPLRATDPEDLTRQLAQGGHLLPLPRESAALANVIEVALVDYLLERLAVLPDADGTRGAERGYPDLEVSGDRFGGGHRAVDVKMARVKTKRKGDPTKTVSRITLFTGNTYFRHPELPLGGIRRPFGEYSEHLDIIGLYIFDEESKARVRSLELLVHEPWRIASRERSSTTREYIGAVDDITDLRAGLGVFATEAEFYEYWRTYPFKTPRMISRELDKLLRRSAAPTSTEPS
ncbi:MAG: type II restriction endonuclease [Acidimicrobiales bacterium]